MITSLKTSGAVEYEAPLTGMALLANLRARDVLTRREMELIAALHEAATVLESLSHSKAAMRAARIARADIDKAVQSAIDKP